MGYSQALSGLSAASTELDTVGNNIANSSTYGFKEGSAEFADMYANTGRDLGHGAGRHGCAHGGRCANNSARVRSRTRVVSMTSRSTATAFFRLSQNGTIEYSRNGQFHKDANGFIVNAEGANLTGYPAGPNGVISTTNPQPLQVPDGNIPPKPSAKVAATSMIPGFVGSDADRDPVRPQQRQELQLFDADDDVRTRSATRIPSTPTMCVSRNRRRPSRHRRSSTPSMRRKMAR